MTGFSFLFVSGNLKENCYSKKKSLFLKYIGIKKGFLRTYHDRLAYNNSVTEPIKGMYIIPHSLPNLRQAGKSAKMFRREWLWFRTEDFSHEQTLVFETQNGLVVFSSCTHAGVDNVLKEVNTALPNKSVYAFVGGLHLHKSSDEEIAEVCKKLNVSGIKVLYTGHCTGENAIDILKNQAKFQVKETFAGLVEAIE